MQASGYIHLRLVSWSKRVCANHAALVSFFKVVLQCLLGMVVTSLVLYFKLLPLSTGI